MKVLLVHNYLRPPTGENAVFDAERAELRARGIETISYEKNNLDIEALPLMEKMRIPLGIVWSLASSRQIGRVLDEELPDIAHFHNTFPLISPSAYYACKARGVPVVQTLHNHRLFCPGGYLLKNAMICTACIDRSLWCSVRNACYHESKSQTSWLAAMLFIHRILGTWDNQIDSYLVLTNFAKELYRSFGLPEQKIRVKPNFCQDLLKYKGRQEGYGIFIGRLGEEKGISWLIEAASRIADFRLMIVGDGPLRLEVERIKKSLNLHHIELCGYKSREETLGLLGKASFLVLPALSYEGLPMVILEAMSLAVPVITTKLGALEELISDGYNGFIVPPKDIPMLADRMRVLFDNEDMCRNMGKNARSVYEDRYTPEKNIDLLLSIYQDAIDRNEKK